MKKSYLLAALILALPAGYATRHYFADNVPAAIPQPEVAFSGQRLDFVLPDLEGTPRDLAEWDGQPRLINFWATWCKPCRQEIPLLKQLQADIDDKHLQVIGIAVEYVEDVIPFAEEMQINYPVLVGQDEAIAVAEQSGADFLGLPLTLVIDANRDLVLAHMGEIKADHLEQIVHVMQQLEAGEIELAGAREALQSL